MTTKNSRKVKVLLVEDDPNISEMYRIKFQEEGYDISTTSKGSEGLDIAKKEKPDIILLDIILPEMDGFAVLESLKSDPATKSIPVIMLSNLGQASDIEKGKKLGAVDYLVKANYTPAQLIEKVQTLLKE